VHLGTTAGGHGGHGSGSGSGGGREAESRERGERREGTRGRGCSVEKAERQKVESGYI
jgi:hypothetical protein